jgi:hypothetical protein
VAGEAGALLNIRDSGTLNGVTLAVNTTLREGTTGSGNQVNVLNGLTLEGGVTLRLERPTNVAGITRDVGLNFQGGAQTLGGSGVVELHSGLAGTGPPESTVRVRPTAGGSLTLGPNVTVRNTTTSQFTTLGDPTLPLVIQGTVSARSPGQTLRVTGATVTNQGVLAAEAGELDVNNLAGNVSGTSISGTGDLDLDGVFSFNLPVEVSAAGSSLTLRGDWDNNTTITQSGGAIHLGGEFKVDDLGAFPGSAGLVSIFGTLDGSGVPANESLTIDSLRQWQLDGGTLKI